MPYYHYHWMKLCFQVTAAQTVHFLLAGICTDLVGDGKNRFPLLLLHQAEYPLMFKWFSAERLSWLSSTREDFWVFLYVFSLFISKILAGYAQLIDFVQNESQSVSNASLYVSAHTGWSRKLGLIKEADNCCCESFYRLIGNWGFVKPHNTKKVQLFWTRPSKMYTAIDGNVFIITNFLPVWDLFREMYWRSNPAMLKFGETITGLTVQCDVFW